MAKLVFKVASDYEKVVRLREEINRLKEAMKGMNSSSSAEFRDMNNRLRETTREMDHLVTEAVRTGAEMGGGLKRKIFEASQVVNGLSARITEQRGVLQQLRTELANVKLQYKQALNNGQDATAMGVRIRELSQTIIQQRSVLYGLTQQQANARLEVRRLRDEYDLYNNEARQTIQVNNEMNLSLGKILGVIGGTAALKQFVSDIVRVRGEFQQLEIAFGTMLKSKEKADNLMNELVGIAAKTPFDLQGIASSAKQMLAYGSTADKVGDELVMLGNIAAGVGAQLGDIAYLYGTLRTQGRAYAVDIRQFAGRGIPIYEELAKVMGVTKDKVSDLVKEGKVGFPQVEQAFKNMTSSTGIYFNLMEEQSKSLTGQISNLGDAWDSMLNEIGKSTSGVFYTAIGTAKTLIENYEKVGAVVFGLIATYGTYKAAMLSLTAIEKVRAIQRLTAIKQITLMKFAQDALNASMLKNPYVLAASAIIGLGVALYGLIDRTSVAEQEQKRLQERTEKNAKAVEDYKSKTEDLVSAIKDEGKSEGERQDALNKLKGVMPGVFDDCKTYADLVNKGAEADRRATEAIRDKQKALKGEAIAEDKEILSAIEKWQKERAMAMSGKMDYNKFMQGGSQNKVIELWRKYGNSSGNYMEWAESMKQSLRTSINKEYEKMRQGGNTSFDASLSKKNIKELKDITKRYEEAIEQATASGKKYIQLQGDTYPTAVSELKRRVSEAQKQIKFINDNATKDFLAEAKKSWQSAEKKVQSIIRNRGDRTLYPTEESYAKALKEAKEASKNAKKKYDEMGGDAKAESKAALVAKRENKLAEMERKYAQQRRWEAEDLEIQVAQARVDAMQEGGDKVLAQQELRNKKELQAIIRAKEDYVSKVIQQEKSLFEANADNKGKRFNPSSVSVNTSAYDSMYEATQSRQENEKLEAHRKAMYAYLKEYGSFEQKKYAIKMEYQTKMDEATNEWDKKSIGEKMKEELRELEESAQKSTSAIAALFGDMSDKTQKELDEILKKGKAALAFLQKGEWDPKKGEEFGITENEFNKTKSNPEKMHSIQKGVEGVEDATRKLMNPFKQMMQGFKDLGDANGEPAKVQAALDMIAGGLAKVKEAAGFLSDSLTTLGDTFDSNAMKGIAEGIDTVFSTLDKTMQGAQAGAAFGPWGAAAGAAIGLATSLASSIARIHDAKNEKRIQKLQSQIEDLNKAYERLDEAIESAYSKDASKLIEQQNANLEQQKALIEKQIKEEEKKKKTDKKRIKEWKEKEEQINKQIEENKIAAEDAIFGSDLKSAIENFADAYANAWASGEDKAKSVKDNVKSMMQQMVKESIKGAIQSSKSMAKIREKMKEFYLDNILSKSEQDKLYEMAEQLQVELDKQFGWADSLMKGESSSQNQSATAKGFQAMSQDTAEELNGRFSALYDSNVRIEGLISSLPSLLELFVTSKGILSHTVGIRNIADEMRSLMVSGFLELQQIQENTKKIVKPIKEMAERMATIEYKLKNL